MRTSLQWTVGTCASPQQIPDRFIPAQVPGAVQLDWARAEGWIPLDAGGNPDEYRWMEDSYWLYRTRLEFEPPQDDQRLFFVCGGVDYAFQVRLNGTTIHEQEGMFTRVELDLTDLAHPGDRLEVLVLPAPKSHHLRDDRDQANQSVKPAVSYGWDFHPRLIPLGIWEDTYLDSRPACQMKTAEVFYELTDDFKRADVRLEVSLSQVGSGQVRWQVFDPRRQLVIDQSVPSSLQMTLVAALDHPDLWWPNGQGDPALYTSVTTFYSDSGLQINQITGCIGFRRVRLVMHPHGWDDPEEAAIPRGPDRPPMTLEINGRAIFGKGSNWVSPDIFPGRLNAELYRAQLTHARDAHFNLLRCWGGAVVQKEAFFDLCDELGLMVWQEFPLACTRYEGTPGYLNVLDRESRSIIQRLRSHPSVVMWCGGNELFNTWSRMTNQDLALRLLDRNCYDLDPQRPFLFTSPQMGVGHGWYTFRIPDGREVFQYFPQARRTAYTEYGVPGPADVETIRQIIPPADLFPPRPGTAWQVRHGMRAWDGSETSWLELPTMEHYFGKLTDLESLVEAGQFLQSQGLKFIFEEARRQKPACSMALNWCFNEPWTTAANGSLLSWPAQPKPALSSVAQACRPVLASAQAPKFTWMPGETFTADLWILNDLPEALPAGRMQAILRVNDREYPLLTWDYPGAEANTNLTGPTARGNLPEGNFDRFELHLRVDGHPEWDSAYTYLRKIFTQNSFH